MMGEFVKEDLGEYVKDMRTENTGGGCLVDYIDLKNGMTIGVSDECIALYNSKDLAEQGIHIENAYLYFSDYKEKSNDD